MLGVLLGLFLIVNLDKGVEMMAPDEVRLYNMPGAPAMATLIKPYPGTHVVDEKTRIISVPYGTVDDHIALFKNDPAIRVGFPVPVDPHFSIKKYFFELQKGVRQYASGDLGDLEFQTPKTVVTYSVNSQLKRLLLTTMSTLVPGILLGIVLGYAAALLAAWKSRMGKALDRLQNIVLCLPDFLIVVLIQFAAVLLAKIAGHPVIKIMQIADDTPLLIPIVAIALLPAVLIYGSIRIAVQREWQEGYIKTAYSKGLSRTRTLFVHLLRNTMEDLLTILPRAVTAGIANLVIAEVMTGTFGLGGYSVNSALIKVTSLPVTCAMLASVALISQFLFTWIRQRFIVNTKEGS